jgi:transcriptional regulator with XRE-family HTH domain
LEEEHRKQSWLEENLRVSTATVERMLNHGHVPKPRTLRKLAALLGCKESDLLIPKDRAA